MFLTATFRAFRHRDYLIFWGGLLLGPTGTLIQTTAQSWLIFQLTNSPFYLGLEGLCLGLPRMLFSAFGGAVVDRADRKKIFIVTQTAFFFMALFIGVMDHMGTIRVRHLLLVSGLTGFFVSFEQPVRQSILHHLVPKADLPNAVTLYQMVFNGSMLFGPAILSFTATLLQIHADETNRGRIVSLFGLINRGLGPMGSFPFGLIATAIGAPWTVAGCGVLTVAAVAYAALYRSPLRHVKAVGEN